MNWRRAAFLLGHDLIGSNLRSYYREFFRMSAGSRPRLEGLHQRRLRAVMKYALAEVPFYWERVARPVLAEFPILRKDDVHAEFRKLMDLALEKEYDAPKKSRRYSWVEVKTGGSTGTPTRVIHDKDFRDWGRAGRLYSQHLCGFPIGTPFFMLWGSMRDISAAKDSASKRILNALLQAHPMNAFLMDDARMEGYLREMRASSIDHLMAYVTAAEQLARFAEKRRLPVRALTSIMACAGTVTDDGRETLSRVFGTRVHNKYGSRECADMACECSAGGFHIYHTGVHLEVVDEAGKPVPDGTSGRILVTLLLNHRFPMIRYEIGDVGALSSRQCPCGSSFPLLERVEGRTTEEVTATDGTRVAPIFIRHLIGVVHNPGSFERFQFVQETARKYSLALQVDREFSEEDFAAACVRIEQDLRKVFGADAEIRITREEHIAESGSGKFLYVRNVQRTASA